MNIISLGIPELDRSLGGGIPYPSLVTIEGEHGSGKTVLAQQIVHSMLDNALKVYVITSEATVKEYLQMMKSVKLDVYDYYTSGQLSIYPLHVQGGKGQISSSFSSSFFPVNLNFNLSFDKFSRISWPPRLSLRLRA